jgi:DNA-binding CsgD family transcriptional regulator
LRNSPGSAHSIGRGVAVSRRRRKPVAGARFTTVPGPVRLVLDDLQELTAAEPLRGLAGLVRSRQPGLLLILATRSDPMLPLSRMRLTEELCELRARDLAFSVDEAQALLAGAGVQTQRDQVRLLVDLNAVAWSYGLLMQARPRECLRQVATAAAFAGRSHDPGEPGPSFLQTVVAMFGAVARFDLGAGEAALADLRAARATAPAGAALGRPEAIVALFEHGAAARMGRSEQTRAVLHWAAERLGETGDVLYIRAWAPASVSLAAGMPHRAAPRWPRARPRGAALRARVRRPAGGTAATRRRAGGGRRADGRQLPGLGRLTGVAEESLGLRRERVAGPPEVPLTNRERAVLALLPSLMPLGEIAEELSVSVNTVKTHVRSIYAKLAVDSRRGAVDAAVRSVCSTRRRSAEGTTGRTVTRPLTTQSCRRSVPRRDEAGGPCASSGPAAPGPARGAPTGPLLRTPRR